MEKVVLKTDLSCKHCVMKVEPILKEGKGIVSYSIDLEDPNRIVTIESEGANIKKLIKNFSKVGYTAEIV